MNSGLTSSAGLYMKTLGLGFANIKMNVPSSSNSSVTLSSMVFISVQPETAATKLALTPGVGWNGIASSCNAFVATAQNELGTVEPLPAGKILLNTSMSGTSSFYTDSSCTAGNQITSSLAFPAGSSFTAYYRGTLSSGSLNDNLNVQYNSTTSTPNIWLNGSLQETFYTPTSVLSVQYPGTSPTSGVLIPSPTYPNSQSYTLTVLNNGPIMATGLSGRAFSDPTYSYLGGAYPGTGGTCGASLSPGANCTVIINVTPTASSTSYSSFFTVDYAYDAYTASTGPYLSYYSN
jgi:hypothetical protein